MLDNIKIGFIGFGNMAQAMADGFIFKEAIKPNQIYACARNWEKLCVNTVDKGINPCKTVEELVGKSDIVVIAVKPYLIEEVITPIRENLKGKIVISVAAGYSFEKYETLLCPGTSHISTIPKIHLSL